jgi:pimeloyl-ACP methyl ester carboxylesterase
MIFFAILDESFCMVKSNFLPFFCLTLFLLVFSPTNLRAETPGKNPVIIISGITGSTLVNQKTGKTVWFNVRRDKDDDLRLPMTSTNLALNRDALVATDIIREVKLPSVIPDVEVYQGVIDSLKAKGYAEADWKNPKATDVFYIFAYDWRRDNVESARLLIEKIEAVKRASKRADLKFDIIAHSMGGLLARYAAMYGAADLQPEGRSPRPTWAGARHINKILMFGTPNEGSFGTFEALINGYSVVSERNLPFIDDMSPEDALTIPSLYQLMPHQTTVRFLDENLKPLRVDFYNVKTWQKYNWGAIADPGFLSKLKDAARLAKTNKEIKPETPGKDANADDRLIAETTYTQVQAYLASALSRAKRFQIALDAPVKNAPVQLYAYGGNCEQTLDAVVLLRDDKKSRWITLTDARDIKTAAGAEIKKEQVRAAMFALGDGRVTKSSLLAEHRASKGGTEQMVKTVFPVTSSFFSCGLHTRLFLEQPIQESYLSALVVETKQQP